MLRTLPSELLLQITEELNIQDILQLRQVSTYFREFTRVHSNILVPNVKEKNEQLQFLHKISRESSNEAAHSKDPNRVLKIGIAAMMADPPLEVGKKRWEMPRLLKWLIFATYFDHMWWRYREYPDIDGPRFSSIIIWDEGRIEQWQKKYSMITESRYLYIRFLSDMIREKFRASLCLDSIDKDYIYREDMPKGKLKLAIYFSIRPTLAIFDKIHPELLWARGIRQKSNHPNTMVLTLCQNIRSTSVSWKRHLISGFRPSWQWALSSRRMSSGHAVQPNTGVTYLD
ncbi:hypothetical protein MMC30_006762 [Trapelia coarctata]|nr:hypothetical protein [Trapelia coarctata]